MTERRSDYPEVLTKRKTVTAAQVAASVRRLLESPPGYSFVERM
jgi:hypothetical protein